MDLIDVNRRLRLLCEQAGGQSALAREWKVSSSYINDVLMSRREPSSTLLRLMGLKREVRFVELAR